jgi:hypothetical protein
MNTVRIGDSASSVPAFETPASWRNCDVVAGEITPFPN